MRACAARSPAAVSRLLRRRSLEVSVDDCGCAATPIPNAKMLVFDHDKFGTHVPIYAE